ncbi:LysM peptidoglycan-binding domain-containing protein [Tenacibaculum piscium]|uniref:LysM peptidoglycan-binding domain-containing protein n=1 Tax=Tenacibaculum piscium TaxID=1458515 RepID=UPI001EFA7CD2|nr:LysM peptidoglycan-binding domain-containing protein [Tenacibaculum piscium]MCG8184176.1 LysM peptidoglycan-binding domain-containing protein [Tenacibaculum piscium]MCG8205656.1 LysM peptidoglycan-binding domain-containing protein [Tenacibaculum piscium]
MKNELSFVFLLLIGIYGGYSQEKFTKKIAKNSSEKIQEKKLPEGWDTVLLDNKTAYMNLITGRISRTFPTESAVKPIPKKEFDPTILHKVKKGETLSTIARKYNLKLAKLYQLNSVANFDALKIGQEIVVGYAKNSSEKKAFLNTPTTQSVQKSKEKSKEKTEEVTENITKTINLSEFKLDKKPKQAKQIKQVKDVKPIKQVKQSKQKVKEVKENTSTYHVVATGETLYRIATQYKISVKKIKELNDIKNNTIAIGQKLKIKE